MQRGRANLAVPSDLMQRHPWGSQQQNRTQGPNRGKGGGIDAKLLHLSLCELWDASSSVVVAATVKYLTMQTGHSKPRQGTPDRREGANGEPWRNIFLDLSLFIAILNLGTHPSEYTPRQVSLQIGGLRLQIDPPGPISMNSGVLGGLVPCGPWCPRQGSKQSRGEPPCSVYGHPRGLEAAHQGQICHSAKSLLLCTAGKPKG